MYALRKHLFDYYIQRTKIPKRRLWTKLVGIATIGGALGVTAGSQYADRLIFSQQISEDKTQYCVEFRGQEEQLFQLLQEKPLIKLYYTSGQGNFIILRPSFLKAAKNYHDKAHFMLINCSQHHKHCRNVDLPPLPAVQATLQKGVRPQMRHRLEGLYAQVDSAHDFSYEGIEAFLQKLKLLDPPSIPMMEIIETI